MRAAVLRETPLLIGLLTLIGLETTHLLDWLLLQPALPVLTGLALLSLLVLLMARGVAHHADQLAEQLGEPLGTLVLTGSVIVIELALIASTMLTGESNPTLARDSMFSVLMIVLTGVKGMTLIVAARVQRQGRTQPMQPEDLASVNQSGSSAYINLITTISVLALVLPNFSQDSLEANYSLPINWLLTFVSISLYGIFLRGQVGRYRNLFIDTTQPQASGTLSLAEGPMEDPTLSHGPQGSILHSGVLMAAGLLVLVLIAESMGSLIETGINDLGLPSSLGGLLVGVLVVAPEALNALQAAGKGELQRSLNTLYGSSLSTLCLTVPAVLAIGEFTGTDVILGLDPLESVLLVLTLVLVRPISGRVSEMDGLMLLTVGVVWVALQVVS
ncbi:calcium:proton antiporter [Synechococcus sp. RS9902]|uniref:calcium:proton antiporter n=1 Tax=Synechococcus sp. RS9902 TaxID=221345 RepID=UPI001648B34F|nr:sodium:calcium antiporter [Synechococcus sp. RS9902]QNI96605.1 Ca2+:H+ antiporter [Synechococcus sp. RS9902]